MKQKVDEIISIRSCPHSWQITVFVTRLTRWVPLVEQELLTLIEHLSSLPDFTGVSVALSLGFCLVLCRLVLVFFVFIFCVVCPSIYGFWLPLWYLQTFHSLTPVFHYLFFYFFCFFALFCFCFLFLLCFVLLCFRFLVFWHSRLHWFMGLRHSIPASTQTANQPILFKWMYVAMKNLDSSN